MVFLLTDSEEYREIKCPGVVSIGRGNTNDFRPESQSVSKQHAVITTTALGFGGKADAWLEDLDSRNGTYAGNSPLDLERVKARRKLYDGDYIRFGHSQKYFRYLERIPVDAEATLPPELIVSPSKELQRQLMPSGVIANSFNNNNNGDMLPVLNNYGSNFGKNDSNFQPRIDFNQPPSPEQQKRPEYTMNRQQSLDVMPRLEFDNHNPGQAVDMFAPRGQSIFDPPVEYGGLNMLSNNVDDEHGDRFHSSDQRGTKPKQHSKMQHKQRDDTSDNMTISVNYPVGGGRRNNQHPVSITIDPSGNNSNNNKQHQHSYNRTGGRSRNRIDEGDEVESDEEEDSYADIRRSGGNNKRSTGTKKLTHGVEHLLPSSLSQKASFPQPWNAPFVDPLSTTFAAAGIKEYASPTRQPFSSHVAPSASQFVSEFRLGTDRFKSGALDSEKDINSRMFKADTTSKKSRLTPQHYAFGTTNVASEALRRSWPEMLSAMPSSEVAGRFADLIMGEEVGTTYANYLADLAANAAVVEENAGDNNKRPRKKKRSVGKAAELVLDLPASIVSEVVAESLSIDSHSDSTAGILNTVVRELNDLLRQCLQGSQIVSSSSSSREDKNSSAEFDHVLKGVVAQAVQDTAATLGRLTDSSLLQALQDANADGSCPNKITQYVQQSLDTLARVNAFVLGTFLGEEARTLRTETVYEIVSMAISSALDRLDACNVAIHTIVKRADGEAVQHENKHLPAGEFRAGATSLSIELEQLRRLKNDAELTPWLDRIRAQEAGVLEKKMSRFYRVFDIALRHQLQAALYHWKLNVHALKRHELKIFDLTDRHVVRFKKSYFDLWSKLWKLRTHRRRALQRFGRVIGSRGKDVVRKSFRVWEKAVQHTRLAGKSSEEVAALKYELCNLKATLHDMTNKSEVAANLAAERALNRELSAVNLELRVSLQQMEAKLLEVTGAQSSKRKDLVFQHLIGKEEELAEARRESAFLLSELELLNTINENKQSAPVRARRDPDSSQLSSSSSPERHEVSKVEAFRRAQTTKNKMTGLPGGPSRGGVGGESIVMTKDIARQVVLNEVRRMQQALTNNKQNNIQLSQKMNEEVNKNIQHALATQKLQSRLTAIERSASSLRELLRQRLGDVGVMELIDSLERLGAGPAALLEVPANPSRDDLDYLGPESGMGVRANSVSFADSGGGSSRSNQQSSGRGVNPAISRVTPPPDVSRSDYSNAIDKHIYK